MPDLFAMPLDRRHEISPTEFAYLHLGMKLYSWQEEVIDAVGRQEAVALAAANSSGKTTFCVAPVVLWFLWRFPKARAVITSAAFRQVKNQLWPAMTMFRERFPGWDWLTTEIKTPEGGGAFGFTTKDSGKFEGWHPRFSAQDDPILVVVDEAKTVDDPIFQAVDRIGPQFQMFVSSPGKCYGQFYRCFNKDRDHYHTFRVRSVDCPHIPDTKRLRDLAKYGEDDPTYRSMHLAEFAEDEGNLIMTPQALENALGSQPEMDPVGEKVGFCDFAAGRDENVFAVRKGNSVRIVLTWVDPDTTRTVPRFIGLFREHGLHPGEVWGDADGMGGPIVQQFAAHGFYIQPYSGQGRAPEPDNYQNLLTYVWHKGSLMMRDGLINVGTLDDKTFEQWTSRPWKDPGGWNSTGKLQAMPKNRMKAEFGIASPDRADALLGAIVCGKMLSGAVTGGTVERMRMAPAPFAVGTVTDFST